MIIPIEKIIVGDRIREEIDHEKVKQLAESFKLIGQLNPITVSHAEGGHYKLVAGLHRLEAAKTNGYNEIKCDFLDNSNELLDELAEIDENLLRNELHYLERGKHLARRKKIFEELYPETIPRNKQGHSSNFPSNEIISLDPKPFTEDIASKLNVSQRTVQHEIKIAESLTPEMQNLVMEKDIGKVDAIKLSRLTHEEQEKVVKKMTAEGANTVTTAINELKREGRIADTGPNPESGMGEDIRDFLNTIRTLKRQIPLIISTRIPEEHKKYIYDMLQMLQNEIGESLPRVIPEGTEAVG